MLPTLSRGADLRFSPGRTSRRVVPQAQLVVNYMLSGFSQYPGIQSLAILMRHGVIPDPPTLLISTLHPRARLPL